MLPTAPVAVPMESEGMQLLAHFPGRRDVEFEPYPPAHNLSLAPELRHFYFHSVEQSECIRHACVICIHGYSLFRRPPVIGRLLLVWLLSLEARTALPFPVKAEPPYSGRKRASLTTEKPFWSIIFREQDRRCRAVGFRDDPKLGAVPGIVSGEKPSTGY